MLNPTPMDHFNILFVLPQLERGGSETLVYNLATKIDRNRFHPSVAYLRSDGNQAFVDEFRDNNVEVYSMPKKPNMDFVLMRKLSELVEERKIRIISAHHFLSMVYSFYACKKNRRSALVYTEHSKWEVDGIPLKWRIMGHYLLKHIDGVTAVTGEVADAIRKQFFLRSSKVLTIKNGIDLDRFTHVHDRMLQRRNLGISGDTFVIGMIANFRKIKNHILLLKAFKALLAEHNNLKLLLVGQGFKGDPESSEEEITRFVKNNSMTDNVIFTGYRADIPELLSVMDVVCLSSLNEGLPISLLEAMAAGLPVVGTNVNGIKGTIEHGVNGFIVDPADATSLRNAIKKLLSDREMRRTFGKNSRKIAVESYSIENCIDQYQNVFLSLCLKGARS